MSDTIKNVVISGVVALVITFLAVSTMSPAQGPQGPAGKDGRDGGSNVGAVSGPDRYSPDGCESTNGFTVCVERKVFTTATTTPCAIKSPSATSTMLYAGFNITTASSTQSIWTIATSTTAYATSSGPTNFTIASGALGSGMVGLPLSSGPTSLLAPNTWMVIGAAGFRPADTTKFNGVCSAKFLVI